MKSVYLAISHADLVKEKDRLAFYHGKGEISRQT